MERVKIDPRVDWEEKVEEVGLTFHHTLTEKGERVTYWDESVYYSFASYEIEELEEATNELHKLCLEAAQYIIDKNRFDDLHIPPSAVRLIKETWESEPPSIYGRFDLAYDGKSPPKLLEYNADTPTALLEAGVAQWYWLQGLFPDKDQFNSIHERLVEKWKEIRPRIQEPLYFGCAYNPDSEDEMTVHYLRDTAEQAGIKTSFILMQDLGWDQDRKVFLDLDYEKVQSIFKLYPWEWLLNEEFGVHVLEMYRQMVWIEPIWKMLLSNKGILPILWDLYAGHPNILEAHAGYEFDMVQFVRKPLLGREGANVYIKTLESEAENPGQYGEEGYIYQQYARTSDFDGHHPVIGSWVIDGESAGIGIRESDGLITDNRSRFVPHLIE